jgi:hypothetical protein
MSLSKRIAAKYLKAKLRGFTVEETEAYDAVMGFDVEYDHKWDEDQIFLMAMQFISSKPEYLSEWFGFLEGEYADYKAGEADYLSDMYKDAEMMKSFDK